MGGAVGAFETPDDRTVIFRFKQPYAPLLQQLDATEAPIVARHIYQGSDPQTNPANASPVGTGPFKLSLIHISEPTRQAEISYAVFCLKKKKSQETRQLRLRMGGTAEADCEAGESVPLCR